MIRILHIVGSLGGAGLESMVMNYYRNVDKKKIQFDFIVSSVDKQKFDDEVLMLGGRIYRLASRFKSPHLYMIDLARIIKRNHYNCIHIHQNSATMALEGLIARVCGVKTIIGHSHNTSCDILWAHYFLKPLVNLFFTHRFACSKEAGEWVFGKSELNVRVINNAIDTSQYVFNNSLRESFRQKFNCEDNFVVGFVGRLHHQKNLFRFLDICRVILDKNPRAVFFIIGDGELNDQLRHYSEIKGISDVTNFLGNRNDIPAMMMMFDVFLMTSVYEGLPVVEVEAQAAGLPCIISNKVPAIDLIGRIKVVSLDESDEVWANEVCRLSGAVSASDRSGAANLVIENNYDIRNEARDLQAFYLSL